MKGFLIWVLLIIEVITTSLQEYKGNMKGTHSSILRKNISYINDDNDISICGSYSYRTCNWVDEIEFFGFPTNDPIFILSRSTEYEGDEEFEKVVSYSYSGSVKSLNKTSIQRQFNVTVLHIYITFYKKPAYQCEEAIELKKEYDATTIHCKDESGKDPLESFKKLMEIGDKMEVEFMKKNMVLKNKKFTFVDKKWMY